MSDWDFDTDGKVSLTGPWSFYWSQLLEPQAIEGLNGHTAVEEAYRSGPIPVPARWGGITWNGIPLSNQGYGTYALQLELPDKLEGKTMALYIRGVATAYRIWINGTEEAGSGTVGTSLATMVPRNLPQVIYFQAQKGSNVVVLQVSNFVQRKGGIWEDITLGDARTITHARNENLIYEAFIVGCLIIMGLYHIGLFAFRRQDRSALYFGGICLFVSLRTLVLGEALLIYGIPSLSWELAVKAEYISAFIALDMMVRFINAHYPTRAARITGFLSGAVQYSCTLLVLLLPARMYTPMMLSYQLLVILPLLGYCLSVYLWAIWRRRENSWLHAVGFLLFSATIANDILYYNQLTNLGNLIPLGLLLFLFCQSLSLSSRFARAFRQAERLGEELQHANEFLEQKVRERTYELIDSNKMLESANAELSRAEQFRLALLSNISHELGTPLTSVKGYAGALMDGTITDDIPRYAGRIYERAIFLERMIDDLVELSKLETRQLPFHFQDHLALPLLLHLCEKYQPEMKDGGMCLVWEGPKDITDTRSHSQPVIRVDPVRLEQVFANLLGNVRKYASAGPVIIQVELTEGEAGTEQNNGFVLVKVRDSGPGIPEDERDRLFNRFFRGKGRAGKSSALGTGLGLSICKEIIETHQGNIGYAPNPGGGSTFWFQLPCKYRQPDGKTDAIKGGAKPYDG